jgi:hypothetical protein
VAFDTGGWSTGTRRHHARAVPSRDVERRGGPVDREQALATLILCGSGVVLVLWAVFII